MSGDRPDLDLLAAVMCDKADRWFYGEREVCGHRDHAAPDFRCVRLIGHAEPHDPLWEATPDERLAAYLADVTEPTVPRCTHTSPSPWGLAQCVLPLDHEERHAYSPSEALP